jgi:hypothetical protein
MQKEHVWAAIGFVVVGALGVWLLYLGREGDLPTAFGWFDMSKLSVRIIVTVILAVIALGLLVAYRNVTRKQKR